jgi:hypothetical protein
MEEEQLLILKFHTKHIKKQSIKSEIVLSTHLSNFPMIPFRSLCEECLILRKLFCIRERNSVHALQGVVILVAEEVRCGALKYSDIMNVPTRVSPGMRKNRRHYTYLEDG